MSKILGAIQKNRESVLQDWLQRLKGTIPAAGFDQASANWKPKLPTS